MGWWEGGKGYTDCHTPPPDQSVSTDRRELMIQHTAHSLPYKLTSSVGCNYCKCFLNFPGRLPVWHGGVFPLTLTSAALAEGYNIGLIIRQYIKPAAHIISQTSDRKIWKISQVFPYNIYFESDHSQHFLFDPNPGGGYQHFTPDTMTP